MHHWLRGWTPLAPVNKLVSLTWLWGRL